MKTLSALLLITIVFAFCGDKTGKQNEPATAKIDSTATLDTTDYLPVAHLLNEDMRNVETYAAGILLKRRNGDAKDSMYVKYNDFQLLAGQFFLKELDSTYFRNNYTETSLMDETSKMLNFIYTAKDTTSPLRQVIVYVSPTMANDKIDRIYMETVANKDNVQIDKKLTWKIGKYFYSLTTRQPLSGNPVTIMEKLIWDPQHFADN